MSGEDELVRDFFVQSTEFPERYLQKSAFAAASTKVGTPTTSPFSNLRRHEVVGFSVRQQPRVHVMGALGERSLMIIISSRLV